MLLRWIAGIVVAVSLALVAILASQNRTLRASNTALALRNSELRPGQFVPTFRGRMPNNGMVTVADAADSTRDVLYFFTWTCPYCRESLPAINALAKRLSSPTPAPVRLLGVSLDSLERPDDPRFQLYHFPILRFPERRYQSLYRASRVPALIVVSDDGRVLYSRYGLIKHNVVDSIAAAIEQSRISGTPPRS